MKSLRDVELTGKKVVVRVGFDLPVENDMVVDDARLQASLPTLKYIKEQQPGITVILNHFGRPEGRIVMALSNKIIAKKLQEEIGRKVVVVGSIKELENILAGTYDSEAVFMLENIRFWYQEEANEKNFGKSIGRLFDVYVNDAFSVSHRPHASFVGVPKYTKEKCMGLLFEKEVKNLSRIKNNPIHPAVLIIGGAKIETKLPVIESMLDIYDHILVGGLVANEAIDKELSMGEKVILPVDFAPATKEKLRLDIGSKTVEQFTKIIENAKTIVWNGPMGKFEVDESSEGTKSIIDAIVKNSEAMQVVGGGETLDAIKRFGNFESFNYVSMSGGAMLKFLAGKPLPGLVALEE